VARKKQLRQTKKKLERKLSDPKDSDDPSWVKRWMDRVDGSIAKKEKATEHKNAQRKVGRNRRLRGSSEP
jgi:hypothetical protein